MTDTQPDEQPEQGQRSATDDANAFWDNVAPDAEQRQEQEDYQESTEDETGDVDQQ